MQVLVAFDKFKNSLHAHEACALTAAFLGDVDPAIDVVQAPLSDGGEAFAAVLTQALGGQSMRLQVRGPRGDEREAHWGLVPFERVPAAVRARFSWPEQGRLAVLEMAQAAGLAELDAARRDPWATSTYGVGQLIAAAVEAGAGAILLGVGGSATNDVGVGALEALGLIAYDHRLQPVTDLVPGRWREVASLGGLVNVGKRFPPVCIATDVTNPLLGERGATRVYGPQKGLKPGDADRMERAVAKMAQRLLALQGVPEATFEARLSEPGSGAAGGMGFGLKAALPEVRFVPGAPLVAELLDLQPRLDAADWVLTGEGRWDMSSLDGKGPAALLQARAQGQPVALFVGSVADEAQQALIKDYPQVHLEVVSPPEMPLDEALREAPRLLRVALERWWAAYGAQRA